MSCRTRRSARQRPAGRRRARRPRAPGEAARPARGSARRRSRRRRATLALRWLRRRSPRGRARASPRRRAARGGRRRSRPRPCRRARRPCRGRARSRCGRRRFPVPGVPVHSRGPRRPAPGAGRWRRAGGGPDRPPVRPRRGRQTGCRRAAVASLPARPSPCWVAGQPPSKREETEDEEESKRRKRKERGPRCGRGADARRDAIAEPLVR